MAIFYITRVARTTVGNIEHLECILSGESSRNKNWLTKKQVYDDLTKNEYFTAIWDYNSGKWKKGEKVQRSGTDIKTYNDGRANNNLDNLPNIWQVINFPATTSIFRLS